MKYHTFFALSSMNIYIVERQRVCLCWLSLYFRPAIYVILRKQYGRLNIWWDSSQMIIALICSVFYTSKYILFWFVCFFKWMNEILLNKLLKVRSNLFLSILNHLIHICFKSFCLFLLEKNIIFLPFWILFYFTLKTFGI